MIGIITRLKNACIGKPAKIAWPHRLLHDAVAAIDCMHAALTEWRNARSAMFNYHAEEGAIPSIQLWNELAQAEAGLLQALLKVEKSQEKPMATELKMRDCPMCQHPAETKDDTEGGIVRITMTSVIDLKDVVFYNAPTANYTIGYTAECCNCGCTVSNEDFEECLSLWNGEDVPNPNDEEDLPDLP